MTDIYSTPEYRRSRVAYHIQCITEYFVTLLMADVFIAKLLKSIGLSDDVIGIVSSLTALAFLIQLGTIFLMQHTKNVKKTVVLIDISSMLSFMCVYLLPFIPVSHEMRTVLVFLTIGGGFLLKYLQLNLYYKWGNSFVHPNNRGAFSARNEAISLAAGVVFTLVIGNMVDHYEAIGSLDHSFMIISGVIATLAAIDLAMLLLIKSYSTEDALKQQKPFADVLKNTLGNRNFRHVVIMISMFEISRYMTIGFLGTFKTLDLMLTVGTVQIINIVANALRCVLSRPFGKWADRTSFAHVYRMGLWLCAFSFLVLVFTTRETWWLIIVHTICFNVSMAGIGANANNMSYSYVPIDYFVQAQAIRSSISGVLGFLASLLGSRILLYVQSGHDHVLGMRIHGQQLLALLSVCGLIATILYNRFVVSRQQVYRQ